MNNSFTLEYHKKELPKKLNIVGLTLFLVGLVIIIFGYIVNPVRTAFNNIILLTFLISLGAGSLFLIAIEYVAGAVWSTPFRRVPEILSFALVIVPIFAVPLFFNLHNVFEWTHPQAFKNDVLMEAKAPYLNTTFFILRSIAFFAVWIFFFILLFKNSVKQDFTKEQLLTKKNIIISAVFLPIFAFSLSFSSFDWLMSLAPHWYSTIFGVYYFAGTVLCALAASTIIIVLLNEKGYFVDGLGGDHYYSLGALMFAFINFWAYIAFSQFLLIWYANLPEETFWFLQRWEGNWKFVSIGLIFVHFVVPYFALLSQPSKMDPKRLLFISIWILFAHIYDLYWMIIPTFSKEGIIFGWIEIGFPLFTLGLLIMLFVLISKKINLVPIGDPKLKRGIDFKL
ncbi:quinol:cytochrome C oxidoreductase [Melioribacteraceae bacterium 4301-Me]|uniref:quinol:cytochrome C oxidoreductase n=1 Tax=Pyranulibacter aquaticus TaxID=3163344 RepID=UPI003595139D